jgi:hypothetical protein
LIRGKIDDDYREYDRKRRSALNGRVWLLEILQKWRQCLEGCPVLTANPQQTLLSATMSFDRDPGSLKFLKNSFGSLQESLAFRRELDTPSRSHQERSSKFVFQIFDAFAQRRLGNAQ